MAGMLTHVSIALAGGLILGLIFRNWKYGVAFGFGHLTPDFISFGVPAIRIFSLDFARLMREELFQAVAPISHSPYVWLGFGIVVLLILLMFYKFDKIDYKKFRQIVICEILFLIGVVVHLILDRVIIESSYWI